VSERLPIFEEVAALFAADPTGRHHWHGDPPPSLDAPTIELPAQTGE